MIEKINKLNSMQKEAVLYTDGALLLLAGAGSGKTRVLTHRIAYLLDKGVRPFNILAITFTNKASKEMRERVCEIAENGKEVLVSTFHSMCVRILRRDIIHIGYQNNFTIYDADDSEKLIKEIMKDQKIDDGILSARAIMSEISNQKDKLIMANEYAENEGQDFKKKKIADVYISYEKMLKDNNALDFDDLILKTVVLLTECQDVLKKYQERFKYIMVDEYQDTSKCQYTLIKLLANKYKNICVVGDDDQSIYGWRGADINNVINFEKDFDNMKLIKLEQNYRSTQNILNLANDVIKNNFGRKEKNLWTENEEGSLIKYKKCLGDRGEATFIIESIQEMLQNGYTYKDFAVLYRVNSLSRVIEEQLVMSSVPYKLYGGVSFYGRKEIKDILAYLKVLQNPADAISIKRIINVPKRGIGEVTINKVIEYAEEKGITFFEALGEARNIDNMGRKMKSILEFHALIKGFLEYAQNNSMVNLIEHILEETGYIEELEKETTEEARNRIENLGELINKAIEYDSQEDSSLLGFLENISLVADIDTMKDEENVITLMTIHSSKGLEFPVVFITGFEEGIFPTKRALVDPSQTAIEEERRLLYVGITRAKKELYITSSTYRIQHGKYMNNIVSSFYKELTKEYIEVRENPKKETLHIDDEKNYGKYRPNPNYKPNVSAYLKKEGVTPKNVTIDFVVGDIVSHFKFGKGNVLKIQNAGADYEITIEFEKCGVKKLMANLSKLKKTSL